MTILLARLLSDGAFHSGNALGEELGLGRAAVWKQVQGLQARGLRVDAVSGKGYRIPGGVDLLDAVRIISLMSADAVSAFSRLEVFDQVDSTNTIAMREARVFPQGGYACLAEQQSAGRGRRGKIWASPFARNIYLSATWTFEAGLAVLQGLSLAVGVAICEALEALGCADLKLKWPNDVYHQDRKLAGILVEVVGDVGGPCAAVIGIGLNVSMPPHGEEAEVIGLPWTDLRSIGCDAGRNTVAATLLSSLARLLADFSRDGLEVVLPQWRRLDMLCGRAIDVHCGDSVVRGVAAGINTSGALLLETPAGRRVFMAGEVSVRGFQ